MVTVDFIAERNPHLTRDEIMRRAELTPAMRERIASHRADPLYTTFNDPSETDEQIALGFVAADAAAERYRMTQTMKARLDNGFLVYIENANGERIASCYREDTVYVLVGATGRHELDIANTPADRLEAHWEGFIDACLQASGLKESNPLSPGHGLSRP